MTREEVLRVLERIGQDADNWADSMPDDYPLCTEPGETHANPGTTFTIGDLRTARALSSRLKEQGPEGWQVPEGYRLVPEVALKWLSGEGPDERGHWFGDAPDRPPGAFWWRTVFSRMCAAAPQPAPQEEPTIIATAQTNTVEKKHDYLSTACFHGLHERCRRECKFCATPCRCECHAAPQKKLCPECDGDGEVPGYPGETGCTKCNGTGRIPAASSEPAPAQEGGDALCLASTALNPLRSTCNEAPGANPGAAPAGDDVVERAVDRIVRDVAELPDRTSPDDQPEMMLVSETELADIIRAALSAIGAQPAPQVDREAEIIERCAQIAETAGTHYATSTAAARYIAAAIRALKQGEGK